MTLSLPSFALALALALVASPAVFAEAPAAALAGSTGLCKDCSYSTNDTKKGASAGHKGVKEWYAAQAMPAPAAMPAAATVKPGASVANASPAPAATAPATVAATAAVAAPGAGAGQVWVNTSSKTYHCAGTKHYGKTKQGEYMTEAAAKAAGDHADHGKACAS